MFNSKALKPQKFRWQYEDEKKNLMQNLAFHFKKLFIWPITDTYRRTKERVLRSYDYACFGWFNYDFDMACAWHLLEFKLKRLRHCLRNGHAVQEEEDMKALSELIKIVERLGKGDYEGKYLDQHDKVWGKIQSRTTPNYDDKGKVVTHTWHSWRKKCPENAPKKLKDKERKEFRACYEKAEQDRTKDALRMADLIILHGRNFWD
jgi:hypothetical protein